MPHEHSESFHSVGSELPDPTHAEREQSLRLVNTIREIIAAKGLISFRRFMEMALYQPGLGYYFSGKFGLGGDFVTAPELGSLFARCLARSSAGVLAEISGADILELGAGSGAMAADLLSELERLERLPQRYLILETSPGFKARQVERLAAMPDRLAEKVVWLDTWPENFTGVVLANEVLDAMPVEQFRIGAAGIEQVCTQWEQGQLRDSLRPASPQLEAQVGAIEQDMGRPLPHGYQSELNTWLIPWFQSLATALVRGACVLIDYGYPRREYYSAERASGTLVCHYRHRAHADPYWHPGLQDISVFVDFTAVTEAATCAGFALEGYTSQAQFLLSNGLDQVILAAMETATPVERLKLSQQAKKLTLPGEMGEKFRVIGFSKGLNAPLRGFARNDQSNRL